MMLLFPTLKSAISYGFYCSYKVGQFIVTSASYIVSNLLFFANKVSLLLYIILEDFLIFVQDVLQRIQHTVGLIAYAGESIVFGGYILTEKIQLFYQETWAIIGNLLKCVMEGMAATVNGIRNVLVFIKYVIVLFGDGVWFIVIFVPKSVLSLGPILIQYLFQSCVQIFDSICTKTSYIYSLFSEFLTACHCFVTDVPTESLIGLIIALCFVYIFIQFYAIFIEYFRNKILAFIAEIRLKYDQVKGVVYRILSRSIRHIRPRPKPVYVQSQPSMSSGDCSNVENFCVVCHDRDKCILVLPCKHLCMCGECIEEVRYRTGRCPICRRRIGRTMRVFT